MIRRRRVLRPTASLLAFVISLASCTWNDPVPTADVERGGTLRVGIIDTANCPLTLCGSYVWDPQVSYSNIDYELGRCCLLRSLLSYNGRSTGEGGSVLRPDLAQALPDISPDGLTWTFRLRPGVHYGPPLQDVTVTSQDFIRSIERALGPRPVVLIEDFGEIHDYYLGEFLNLGGIVEGGEAYVEGSVDRISGLEAPDPLTLIVHLTEPTGTLGAILAFPDMAPIPANPFDPTARFGIATDQGRYFGRYLAATGPYMVEGAEDLDYSTPPEEWQQPVGDGGATYTLVRNPSWTQRSDPLRAAGPDRIVISRVASERDALDLISTGALDLIWDWSPSPDDVERARTLPGVSIETSAGDNVRFLGMNVAIPPLDDVHVRRAIAYAVDRPSIDELFASAGDLEGRVSTHVGLDSEENNLLLNFDPFGARDGPDLDAARREMAASAYDRDHDGACDEVVCSGIRLVAPDYDPARVRAAALIAKQLRVIGLEVQPRVLDEESFRFSYGHPEEHVAMRLDAWYKDATTGATWFPPLFGSSSLAVTGFTQSDYLVGANPKELERWGYEVRIVPNVDEEIMTCLGLVFEAQLQCWAELDRHLTEDIVPWVPLLEGTHVTIVSTRLRRFSVDQSAAEPIAALDQIIVPPGPPPATSPSPQPGAFPEIPAGIYRVTVSPADLRRFGFTENQQEVWNTTGTFTMVLGDGVWYSTQRADHPISGAVSQAGTYAGTGDVVRFRIEANEFYAVLLPPMRWTVEGTELRFRMETCGLDPFDCANLKAHFTAHPWEMIG